MRFDLSPPFVAIVGACLGTGCVMPPAAAPPAPTTARPAEPQHESPPSAPAGPRSEPESTATELEPEPSPPPLVVVVTSNPPPVEHVLFEPGGTKLLPAALNILDMVAQVLAENPDVTLVGVEGHADPNTAPGKVEVLAKRRADVVRDQLVARGVAPDRLVARGAGGDCPIAPPGNDRNHRVEFLVLIRGGVHQGPSWCRPSP